MKWTWRGVGLVAAALALSFTWAVSRIDRSLPFAPASLADRIVRLTPGDMATFFIERLQHDALRLLSVGTALAFLIIGALLPEITSLRRARPLPYVAGAILAALIGTAAFAAPIRPPPVPTLLLALAAGVLYAAALAWLVEAVSASLARQADISRRRALGSIAGAALGFALGGTLLGRIARDPTGPQDVAIEPPDRPVPVLARRPFREIPGLSPEITAVADHYVVDIDITKPVVDPDSWRLGVDGRVEQPLELGFYELQRRFPLVEEYSVLTCISNEVGGDLVGNSKWTGVRLRDVLEEARLRNGAVEVVFRCADGYTVSIPVADALDPSAILAIAQNDEPLTREHGFPCRLRVPKLYGIKNPKWIEELEVVDFDYKGYWTRRGWTDVGTVRTQSRIDTVAPEPAVGRPS